MKHLVSLSTIFFAVVLISSCHKSTCTDPTAPNFGAEATCADATSLIVGTYSGMFVDSIEGYGQTATANQTITISRVDASHIQITPADNQFFPYVAKVTASAGNYAVDVTPGSYQGLSYTGGNTGMGANGSFNTGTKAFLCVISIDGTTLEAFSGVKQ